jgi:uncharacterized repeat protein (TIGR03803 family)
MAPAPNGGFYVTESGNGVFLGAVYLVSPLSAPGGAWTQTALYDCGGTPDGATPIGDLVVNQDGSLYGITVGGGQYGQGTVYQLSPPSASGGAWTETVLYSFAGGPVDRTMAPTRRASRWVPTTPVRPDRLWRRLRRPAARLCSS